MFIPGRGGLLPLKNVHSLHFEVWRVRLCDFFQSGKALERGGPGLSKTGSGSKKDPQTAEIELVEVSKRVIFSYFLYFSSIFLNKENRENSSKSPFLKLLRALSRPSVGLFSAAKRRNLVFCQRRM